MSWNLATRFLKPCSTSSALEFPASKTKGETLPQLKLLCGGQKSQPNDSVFTDYCKHHYAPGLCHFHADWSAIQASYCRRMECPERWQPFGSSEGLIFPSFNLVTLGRACPCSAAWSSNGCNGCNTLEDLITTQAAALGDMLGMLKPLPL